jgi:hypothetical protein
MSMERIEIKLHGEQIVARPLDYLARDRFDAYRNACSCLQYKASLKANVGMVGHLPTLVASLISSGFAPVVDSAIKDLAIAEQARKDALKEETSLRCSVIDAELKSLGRALFGFQIKGIEWLSSKEGAVLADDMGLGKTLQALIAAPKGAPILVVCPAVAKGVWAKEAKKWRPDLQVVICKGRNGFVAPKSGEMVVCNYDILQDEAVISSDTILIADEAHALKSAKTARGSRFLELSKQAAKVWLLTATPLLNRPQELYTMLSMAKIQGVFGSFGKFLSMFGGSKGKFGLEFDSDLVDTDQIYKSLSVVVLRRTKKEVLKDLPAKTYRNIEVEIDSKTASNADKMLVKLEKAMNGRIDFTEFSSIRAALATAKIEALNETIDQIIESEQVVVFSAHRAPIDQLASRDGFALITGDTSPEQRSEIERKFQAGELKGIGCTIKAGGVAITLTSACHAVFCDLEWTPALNSQAEDRIYRIGQDRPVTITTLIASNCALDERIAEILERKEQIIAHSVELVADVEKEEDLSFDISAALQDSADLVPSKPTEQMVYVYGKTYDHKDLIKSLGGRWIGDKKVWSIPASKKEELESEGIKGLSFAPVATTEKVKTISLRVAKDEVEQNALGGLRFVSTRCDHAQSRDEKGFSQSHQFVKDMISFNEEFTDNQWKLLVKLANVYRRQIAS